MEVAATPQTAQKTTPQSRFGELKFVTVDSETTRDIDDAMWMERHGDEIRIVVAIADPTRSVSRDSTEDANARLMGSTMYQRDHPVRRMLPPRISEEEGSLVAGRRRKAFIMDIVLDKDLELRTFELQRSAITVAHRLSYEDIPLILQQEDSELRQMIGLAAQVGRMLLQKRRQSGALALYDLSRLLMTDEDGRLVQLNRADEMVGHVIVQELMVLTNTLMASYMLTHNIPAIFRNHEPSSAAPPADELASTIEAWMKSTALDAETVQAQFALIVGKANYSAFAKGHFALAIGCYGHFTSPLRRYADLVNLRQVKAFLKKLPLPYDTTQLNVLALELNEALERRKQERSQGFKDVVERTAVQALKQNRLAHLADHELAKAVKLARAAGELPDALADELVRRLDGAMVTDKLTDTLVIEVPSTLWPTGLKSAFLDWLIQNPSRSMHIVNHGVQTGAFKDLSILPSGEGTAFTAQVQLLTSDGTVLVASGTGARKKESELDGATRLVAKFLGLGLADKTPTTLQSGPPVVGNPKGALLELCQKKGWGVPEFVSSGKGPSHAMVFAAKVGLVVAGQPYSASVSGASTKKEAEARASEELMAQLTKVSGASTAALAVAAGPVVTNVNPIGALMEKAQKAKLAPPDFVFTALQNVPPTFQCVTTIVLNGARRSFTATSSTKQEAKTISAKMAFDAAKSAK